MRHSFTLTWRSVLKIRTNSEDLLGLSLQPIMFLLLFTYVFGGAIAHGSVHAYLQYVLPGILVQTVLFATLGTGLMLNQDISAGIFDRFRSLPIARWAPLAGAIMGDVTRYVISVVVTLGFGMCSASASPPTRSAPWPRACWCWRSRWPCAGSRR